jgi:DNA-binding Lrp family transcriptional regulator
MSVSAYILIQADVGTAVDVAAAVSAIDLVHTADVAMGPYDVIARAEAQTMDELGQVVVHAVQGIAGVERTLLCPIVNL